MLHDEFCIRRPLLAEEEFQLLWGLTRLVPGINLLALTVMLGYRTAGIRGALLALLGLTAPSFMIIVCGCIFLRRGMSSPEVLGAVRGLSLGAAALMIVLSWQICGGSLRSLSLRMRSWWLGVALIGMTLLLLRALNTAWIVVGGAVLGVLLVGRAEEPAA